MQAPSIFSLEITSLEMEAHQQLGRMKKKDPDHEKNSEWIKVVRRVQRGNDKVKSLGKC